MYEHLPDLIWTIRKAPDLVTAISQPNMVIISGNFINDLRKMIHEEERLFRL